MEKIVRRAVRFNEDPFSKWGVSVDGYVVDETGKPVEEVFEYVEGEIERSGMDLGGYDYFQVCFGLRGSLWPVSYRRIACFAVEGGSEGHYIHVNVIDNESKTETLLLGKTFLGLDHALALSNALTKILACNN
ncbi:MAG: hypothetical protein ABIL06_13185 [Pseudomonadota bacterium]|uniref:Uncharacterized protein n=1 Tax=viral metagenome TaxID=1070528 RepID=A0A6H1ZHS9_9ZZZZ